MYSFTMALYNKEEEQKKLLKTAQMRLEKVEEILKPLKSKHFKSEYIDNTKPLHGRIKSNNHETQHMDNDSSSFATLAKSRTAGQIYDPECATNSDDENDLQRVSFEEMSSSTVSVQSTTAGTECKKSTATYSKVPTESGQIQVKRLLNRLAVPNVAEQRDTLRDLNSMVNVTHLPSLMTERIIRRSLPDVDTANDEIVLCTGTVGTAAECKTSVESAAPKHEAECDQSVHFSRMLFIPKGSQYSATSDIDRWRSKKLSHDLEMLYVHGQESSNQPPDMKSALSKKLEMQMNDVNGMAACHESNRTDVNRTVVHEDVCQHLGTLSVETQWDSQFVDSLGVKRVHLEAVKDWRKTKPLDLLMSGTMRDQPLDESFLSLPSVVNDLVVNELWIEVQKSLSHQIGENDEITEAVADSMLTQLSQDLEELTQTIATKNSIELNSVYCVSPDQKYLVAKVSKTVKKPESPELGLKSSLSVLTQMEQQLECIRTDTASQQSLPNTGSKNLQALSLEYKNFQKLNMTVNLNSHSQHRVADCTLERTQTPSVEADDYSSRTSEAMTASDVSSVKRKRDEPSEFYDADNKDSTFSRKKLNSSKSESDMEVSSEKLCFSSVKYLREKVYENEDFLKSKKKRKSGRNRHKRESVNSEKFTYRATSPGALDLEREVIADVEEVKLNQAVGSILTSSAEVVSQQFSMNLEMSSPEQVVSSHPSETTKSLSELSETDDSLHSVVKGALEDLQEDMVSLYYDRFGIRCKSSIDCRAVELTSPQHGLKSLSHIPLMMHRSTAINDVHSNVRFPCFDDNCASNVTDKLTTESRKADEAWNISRIKSNARSRKCVEKGEKQFDGRTVIDQPEKIKEKLTAGVKYTIHSGLTVDLESPLSPPAAQKVSKDVDSGPLNAASVIPIQSNHEMIPSDNSLQLTVQQSRTLNQSHLINYVGQQETMGDTCSLNSVSFSSPCSSVISYSVKKAGHNKSATDTHDDLFLASADELANSRPNTVTKPSRISGHDSVPTCIFPIIVPTEKKPVTVSMNENNENTVTCCKWDYKQTTIEESMLLPHDANSSSLTSDVSYAASSCGIPESQILPSTSSSMHMSATESFNSLNLYQHLPSLTSSMATKFENVQWPGLSSNVCHASFAAKNVTSLSIPEDNSTSDSSSGVHMQHSGTSESSAAVESGSCPVRIFVFNKEKMKCKLAEASLTCMGARVFDPYNIVLLRAIFPLECLVLVHSGDLAIVHRIPNLLRLKRDLRVSFVSYDNVNEALNHKFTALFPRSGLVVMDTGTLVHCNPDNLEKMCQFMQKQATEKGITWRLMISPDIAEVFNKHRCEACKTDQHYSRLADVITRYCSLGYIESLPKELFRRSKMSALDYQRCCLVLQERYLTKYRHFLFLTDVVKQHVDVKGFTDNGIDVLSIAGFLRGFVGHNATSSPRLCKEYIAALSTEVVAAYVDAASSTGTEILMNKWTVPFTGRTT